MSNGADPAKNGAVITPADSGALVSITKCVYVGSDGGNIVAIMNGIPCVFTNVPRGILPIAVSRINATGTTATNLVALW